MKMRIGVCLAAALLVGGAVPAAAQQGGGTATRGVERLAERSPVRRILDDAAALGLTREQVRALEAMDRELSARADSAVAALRTAEARPGARGRSGARAAPGRQLRDARAGVLRAQNEAEARAQAILTPAQRERLAQLTAQRRAPGRS